MKRPSFLKVFLQFILLILCLFSVRWFIIEPFTVPSGSMFPTLRINDYILVSKLNTGIKIPFTTWWAIGPRLPKRGTVVVFMSVKSNSYFVKRLVGLPGDKLVLQGDEILEINGFKVRHEALPGKWDQIKDQFSEDISNQKMAYIESYDSVKDMGVKSATLMYPEPGMSENQGRSLQKRTILVPPERLFFMGDHRSASSDSRLWGFVDEKDIVGPVRFVLFSCQNKNISTQFCDPSSIRWDRSFSRVH